MVLNLPIKKTPDPVGFSSNCHPTFEKEIILFLYSFFQRLEKGGILSSSLYKARKTLTLNLKKEAISKELKVDLTLENHLTLFTTLVDFKRRHYDHLNNCRKSI